MYNLYLKACLERAQLKKASHRRLQERTERCLHVFAVAASSHCLSEAMAIEWLQMLVNTGQEVTLQECVTHVTTLHPQSVALWREFLSYQILQQVAYEEIYPVFKKAVASVNAKESLPLWKLVYEWLVLKYPVHLEGFLEFGLVQCAGVCVSVKEWYLEITAIQGDIHKIRNIYKRLSTSHPLSVGFFEKYIYIENNQIKVKMKKLRSAYEDAIREYGNSAPDLWLNYIRMELEHPDGAPENAGNLHWRAVKALEGDQNEEFNRKYTLMHNGHI